MVLRKRVVTSHFLATRMRSWLRINLQTAAAISGVTPRANVRENIGGRRVRQQPVTESPHGQRGNRGKRRRVVAIDDQAGHLVLFIGNDRLVQKLRQRHIGQRHPRRHHLFGGVGCQSREPIAGARRGRLGEKIAQIVEYVGRGIDGMAIVHGDFRPCGLTSATPLRARDLALSNPKRPSNCSEASFTASIRSNAGSRTTCNQGYKPLNYLRKTFAVSGPL